MPDGTRRARRTSQLGDPRKQLLNELSGFAWATTMTKRENTRDRRQA